MIAVLDGVVLDIAGDALVLGVGGVGYLLRVPLPLLASVQEGQELMLHVTMIVRQDSLALFGFGDKLDKESFDILIEVNGVGPKLALAALSTLSAEALSRAVANDDAKTLVGIPGVGMKLARRLVNELADRLPLFPDVGGSATAAGVVRSALTAAEDDLALALSRLGFRRSEIVKAVAHLSQEGLTDASLERRLVESLRLLGHRSPTNREST